MQLLLARGRTRAHGQGHGKCIQEMAVACRKRDVPSLRHQCHGTNGMYRMLSIFIERNGKGAIKEMRKTIDIARMSGSLPDGIREEMAGNLAYRNQFFVGNTLHYIIWNKLFTKVETF